MRRLIAFGKSAVARVNARVLILIAVVAAGGVAVWQGLAHWPARQPAGPTKQIATGVSAAEAADPLAAQQAPATSPDAQVQGTDAAQLWASGRQTSSTYQSNGGLAPPSTSPYAASVSDLTSGAGATAGANYTANSGHAVSSSANGSAAQAEQPTAAPPADPSLAPPPAAVPANPYRTESSPPAATVSDIAPSVAQPTEPASASPADLAAAYANRYNQPAAAAPPASVSSVPPANELTAAAPSSAAAAPPNRLPSDAGAINPNEFLQGSGLSRLQTTHSQPGRSPSGSPLPEGEGAGKLAANKPGDRQLEGPQQPALLLEKVSPAEIQVGKAAVFELFVRNAGRAAAHNVVVTDHVPAGTQLVDAKPQPQQGADGSLIWNFGVIQPGEEQHISLEIMPQAEGPIGSTAEVTFAAAATSRSICTRPQLAIEQRAASKALIGESVAVEITVYNAGTGPATGVMIEEDVPENLEHAAGPQLEYQVGTLQPGESKQVRLMMRAKKAGLAQNVIRAHGDGNLTAQHAIQVEIVAPQLQVGVDGPKTKYLERQATYTLQIANPGTAAARNVELIARLPRGMKFVTTDSQGQYDPAQHAVYWSLAELAPAQAGQVKLTTLPVEPGEQRVQVEGRAEMGLSAAGEQIIHVEQSAELVHTVKDSDEVIEVGSETTYEIRVVNTGTKAATNVRIAALMPEGMLAKEGLGPTAAANDPIQVIFEPLNRLNPREEVIYKVRVQATQPGEKVVRVQLSSDEWKTPVTREESTRVYQDR